MEDNRVETTVLVLTGEAGELYAIPQDALEQYHLTDEQKAELEKQLGGDVSGYSMYQDYLTQQTAAYKQAELRQRGEEIRHKADLAQMAAASDQQDDARIAGAGAEAGAIRKLFTGVLATLRLAPARITKEPLE